MIKKEKPEIKVIIYTNEEKNNFIVDVLCEAIAKYLYETNFKPLKEKFLMDEDTTL